MKKISLLSLALAASLSLSGCATLFGDNGRSVNVTTQPQGAQVYLNGQPIGTTPTTVQLASVSNNYLQISKKGYQTTSVPIDTAFQKVGLWNILFWPAFIVDAVSGDMMKIANTNMSVQLQPNPAKHTKHKKAVHSIASPSSINTIPAASSTNTGAAPAQAVTPTPTGTTTSAPAGGLTPTAAHAKVGS